VCIAITARHSGESTIVVEAKRFKHGLALLDVAGSGQAKFLYKTIL